MSSTLLFPITLPPASSDTYFGELSPCAGCPDSPFDPSAPQLPVAADLISYLWVKRKVTIGMESVHRLIGNFISVR